MKNQILTFALALSAASFLLNACGGKSDPKDTALNFLNALKTMDYETAKKFATPKTDTLLDMIAGLSSFGGAATDSIKAEGKKIKIDLKDPVIDGDRSTISFTSSDNPNKEETINLIKNKGKWEVEMTKDQIMGEPAPPADEDMPDAPPGNDSIKVDAAK